MKIQLATLAIVAAAAFAACETANTNTATGNRAVANGNTAVVTNANSVVNTNAPVNAANTANSNTVSSINFNGTREEISKQSKEITAEAKRLGGSIGEGASDAWIWTKTRAALVAASDLRDSTINVDVSNDVITLKGTVATKEQKAAAVKIANSIEGKKSVKDELAVKANDSALPGAANSNANAAPIKKS